VIKMTKSFQLTGNPFVDTGLYVLSYLAKADNPEDLTLEAIRAVYGDGTELARTNARLASFTTIFTPNGPLTQSQYRPKGKQKELSEKNIKAYTGVLSSFLEQLEDPLIDYPLCEICGVSRTFNFDRTVRQALMNAGITDRGAKQVGREWFPLAGSLGNDAQALPSASRGLSVCAKCLFAVHYMPLGMMLMGKRLLCFQSNVPRIAMELTADNTYEYLERLRAEKGKLETIGKGRKTTATTERLLSWMEKRQQVIKEENLPQSVYLTVWLFNNGKEADCELMEIPNHALQFLWQACKQGFRKELLSLIAGEGKISDYQLLTCIQDKRDYLRLYQYKTFQGASPKLFALYHQLVLGESVIALQNAQKLARSRLETAKPKERKILQKAGAIEGENGRDERKRIKQMMIDAAKQGQFSQAEYESIFPTMQRHPIRVDYRGWRTIGYYLSNPNGLVPDFSALLGLTGARMTTTHPKIKEAAQLFFQDYIHRRGIEHFERHIIDGFSRTNPNGVQWLRDVFIRLAQNYPGFTYDDWDEFVLDENGQLQATELLFQMRLELANLYRIYVQIDVQKGEPK